MSEVKAAASMKTVKWPGADAAPIQPRASGANSVEHFEVNLVASNQRRIDLDISSGNQAINPSTNLVSYPAVLKVEAPRDAHVRAVLLNWSETAATPEGPAWGPPRLDVREFDLEPQDDGTHAVAIEGLPIRSGAADFIGRNQQELAVVVNGGWLKDPMTGKSNFQFNLEKARDAQSDLP